MSLAMHVCARKHGLSLQELMAEAFDDVLRKYGQSPVGVIRLGPLQAFIIRNGGSISSSTRAARLLELTSPARHAAMRSCSRLSRLAWYSFCDTDFGKLATASIIGLQGWVLVQGFRVGQGAGNYFHRSRHWPSC
jgi:hypothetical protein